MASERKRAGNQQMGERSQLNDNQDRQQEQQQQGSNRSHQGNLNLDKPSDQRRQPDQQFNRQQR